ncbi:MAG: transcription elongation factor GreA [Bacteroidales bacterium]|nr:transcription elongation factor GreA [Bacteroidales bacterium]
MEYLSKQRHDEIVAELNHLIDVVYPRIREDLAETSAQGDRSDNAGYREARRNQAKTISRIRFLQKVLEYSRVIDTAALPKDKVCLLSRVEFTNLTTNARMQFKIVSPHEMDLEGGKISLKSPIGAALMGKKVGEIVEVRAPAGTLNLRIESITLDDGKTFADA